MILDSNKKQRFEARARIIKALAHPTRLFIVDELARSEKCVNDLTKMIGSDISTVSKHLSILKQAGIVNDEKRGLQVWYSLRIPCILNFFGCIEDVLKANIKQARQAAMK
ncbi:MAG: metalloregulator ArsR/SmtB family transcription factor [candidate division Zixibacteria bacterium]